METSLVGSVPGRFGRPFRHLSEIDSTNTEALRWAEAERVPEGALVVAESQTAGRGRWGRTWLSRPGASLLMSLVLRPAWTGQRLGLLTLACGLATARAMGDLGLAGVDVKWPNDVLIGGKKVAGILVESRLTPGDQLVVVGIGVNLSAAVELPPEIAERATDLATAAGAVGLAAPKRPAVLRALLSRLEETYEALGSEEGPTQVRAEVRERLTMLGADVVVRLATGESRTGTAEDLQPDGSLRLRTEDGTETVHAGEIETIRTR